MRSGRFRAPPGAFRALGVIGRRLASDVARSNGLPARLVRFVPLRGIRSGLSEPGPVGEAALYAFRIPSLSRILSSRCDLFAMHPLGAMAPWSAWW